MPIKVYKPTTAARRNSSVNAFVELTKWEPEKSLIERRKKTGGRNHTGWITCRHIGGGKLVNRPGLQRLYLVGAGRAGVRRHAFAKDGVAVQTVLFVRP